MAVLRITSAPSQTSKLVILIQDLHAHYGVQKNIAEILNFLTKKLSKDQQKGIPFALAVEGAEGPIDTSVMARFPDQKIKREALDYLMREGELTGMDYFAAMQGVPKLLVGVEGSRYYNAIANCSAETLENRTKLVEMLRGIQADINTLRPSVYSHALATYPRKN